MNFNFQKEKGFTMIELIISIFILSVALVGVYSAFSTITILTEGTADRVVAISLAQEGMEIVRNIRDSNWLAMDANPSANLYWTDGLSGCDYGCELDYTTTGFASHLVKRTTGEYLYTNSAGFYGYNTGSITKFQRKVIITPITDSNNKSDHILKVIVQVSWDERANILRSLRSAGSCGPSNCVTAEGTLYDWYNYINE